MITQPPSFSAAFFAFASFWALSGLELLGSPRP